MPSSPAQLIGRSGHLYRKFIPRGTVLPRTFLRGGEARYRSVGGKGTAEGEVGKRAKCLIMGVTYLKTDYCHHETKPTVEISHCLRRSKLVFFSYTYFNFKFCPMCGGLASRMQGGLLNVVRR